MTTTTQPTARERMATSIAGQTDAMLCTIAVQLYAEDRTYSDDDTRAAEHLTRRMVVDELIGRHPKANALMDEWFGDESPEALAFITEHTYGELCVLAVDQA